MGNFPADLSKVTFGRNEQSVIKLATSQSMKERNTSLIKLFQSRRVVRVYFAIGKNPEALLGMNFSGIYGFENGGSEDNCIYLGT